MDNLVAPILAELDTNLVIAIAVLMIILLAVSIWVIKKVTKMVIFLACVVICLVFVVPAASSFQEKYNFSVEDNNITIISDGQEYTLGNLGEIKDITMVYNGMQGVNINIKYKDSSLDIEVPVFINNLLKEYLDSRNMDYVIKE